MKVSNKFTTLRVLLAPVFFIIYFLPKWFGAAEGSVFNIVSVCILIPLLTFAELTDYFDGFYARRQNEVSDFGKIFDPFADVFLHLSTFICFTVSGYLPPVILIFIFYREFAMNFFRMVAAKQGVAIAARKGGKLKTVFYVFAGAFSLFIESVIRVGLADYVNIAVLKYINIGIYAVCLILAYISFFDYFKNFKSLLKKGSD